MNRKKIRNIAVMDTSILSFNVGDHIIMESARKGLGPILENAFVVNMPTHSPLFHQYEFSLRNIDSFRQALNSIDLKFVCGTNLLEKNMKKRKNSWNLHTSDLKYFNDFVLVGVGTDGLEKVENDYTVKFYQKALSHDYIHSTRDEKTKEFLESLGLKALNTGCVTLWPLTKEHCSQIPIKKADTVVFTITDYKPDIEKDRYLINELLNSYDTVYCWLQGIMDSAYLDSLKIENLNNKVHFITPTLAAYNEFLETHDCDYVGTRLHAGIKAIQKKRRSIIIGVDNRARDIHETYGIPLLERTELEHLTDVIQSDLKTDIRINEDRIKLFLSQFEV